MNRLQALIIFLKKWKREPHNRSGITIGSPRPGSLTARSRYLWDELLTLQSKYALPESIVVPPPFSPAVSGGILADWATRVYLDEDWWQNIADGEKRRRVLQELLFGYHVEFAIVIA